jgi:hypothetical protein
MERKVLTCEQCGAPYLEGVTICYVCGAPIGEDEQPTHPVRVPIHLRARVTTVLPAVRPERSLAHVARADAPAAQSIAPPRASKADAWTRIPRAVRDEWANARPAQLALLALSLVAFVAGIVILCYRLIPPAVPAQAVYRDPAHRFHCARPALWQTTPTDDGVRLTDSTGTSTALIVVAQPVEGNDVAPYADSLAESLGIGPTAPVVVAGVTWQTSMGQVTGASGATYTIAEYVTLRRGQIYIVELSGPAGTFDTTNTLVFQPLLRSFGFD